MTAESSGSIWTRPFALLCLSQFLGYAQHFLLAPVLPLYVTALGGSPVMVGIVLAAFAVTSVLVRPLVGHWADRWSETGVLIAGLIFQGAAMFLCLIPSVAAVLLANGARGIGWAGVNTGGYSLLALTAPPARRGQASGLYSGVQSSPTILFPAVALWILAAPMGGFAPAFMVATLLSFAGAGAAMVMARGSPHGSRRPQAHASRPWWREVFHFVEPGILLPAVLLLWLNLSLPSMTNFVVLYAGEIGIEPFGIYFVVSGVTSLLARPGLGWLSDKVGRTRSMAAGFTLQVLGLSLIAMSTALPGILAAGVLYMLGNAIGSSTTLAMAVERADPNRRGQAMATFSVAYPLSYGVGSLLTGSAVAGAGYVGTFLILAALQAAGFVFALLNRRRLAGAAV